jgi:hypothetical protein
MGTSMNSRSPANSTIGSNREAISSSRRGSSAEEDVLLTGHWVKPPQLEAAPRPAPSRAGGSNRTGDDQQGALAGAAQAYHPIVRRGAPPGDIGSFQKSVKVICPSPPDRESFTDATASVGRRCQAHVFQADHTPGPDRPGMGSSQIVGEL